MTLLETLPWVCDVCHSFYQHALHSSLFLSKPQKVYFGKERMQAEILQTCTDAGEMRTKSQSISILNHYEKAHMYQKRIKH